MSRAGLWAITSLYVSDLDTECILNGITRHREGENGEQDAQAHLSRIPPVGQHILPGKSHRDPPLRAWWLRPQADEAE